MVRLGRRLTKEATMPLEPARRCARAVTVRGTGRTFGKIGASRGVSELRSSGTGHAPGAVRCRRPTVRGIRVTPAPSEPGGHVRFSRLRICVEYFGLPESFVHYRPKIFRLTRIFPDNCSTEPEGAGPDVRVPAASVPLDAGQEAASRLRRKGLPVPPWPCLDSPGAAGQGENGGGFGL